MRLLFKYDKEWTLYPWRCSLATKGEHSTRNKQTLSLLSCIFVHERDYYHILPQNIILSEHRVLERDVKDFIQISDVVHVILVVGLCSWAQLPAAVREISPRSTKNSQSLEQPEATLGTRGCFSSRVAGCVGVRTRAAKLFARFTTKT